MDLGFGLFSYFKADPILLDKAGPHSSFQNIYLYFIHNCTEGP